MDSFPALVTSSFRTANLLSRGRYVRAGSILLLAAGIQISAAAAAPITLVLSADTEGHVEPCQTCPSAQSSGGLARRATLVEKLRKESPALLLLDAGNAFIGSESLASRGRIMVSAYDALRYDAVNLSHRDFRLGKAATLELLKGAKFPVVSANLLDADKREPLIKPYVVRQAGERKVAVIGISEVPAGMDFLPHFKEQFAGVTIEPPADALTRWIPLAKKEADDLILLYYGSSSGARQIAAKFGGQFAVVLAGGMRPEQLPPASAPPILATGEAGRMLAQITLTGSGPDAKSEVKQWPIDGTLEPDSSMQLVLAEFRKPAAKLPEPATVVPEKSTAKVPSPRTQPAVKKTPVKKPPATKPEAAEPDIDWAAQLAKLTGAGRQTEKQRDPAGYEKLEQEIEKAIRRGAAWLKTQHGLDRDPLSLHDEYPTIGILALIHAGELERDPALAARCVDYLLRRPLSGTYDTALTAMALRDLDPYRYRQRIHEAARWLVENQRRTEGSLDAWQYGRGVPGIGEQKETPPTAVSVIGGIPFGEDEETPLEVKRQNLLEPPYGGYDNSCSQFAVLGLHAAAQSGIKIPREAWEAVQTHFLREQKEDGGWPYSGGSSFGSMTCSGIASLVIARHHLGAEQPLLHPAAVKGLQWLAEQFTVEKNPKGHSDHYYYLYGLERVGVLGGTEFIGEHEWYPTGARYLLSRQSESGSWQSPPEGAPTGNSPSYLDTSYAILFLRRATLPLKPPKPQIKHGGPGKLVTEVPAEAGRLHIILDASNSMRARVGGKSRMEVAQQILTEIIQTLPENTALGLRVFGHKHRMTEEGADRDTEMLVEPGTMDRQTFLDRLHQVTPVGRSPITYTLEQLAGDLQKHPKNRPMAVVLISNGAESVRLADPAKAAAALVKERPWLKLHVIGFQIDVRGAQQQLKDIATAGNGEFFMARDALQMKTAFAAIRRSSGAEVPFRLLDAKGDREILNGTLGKSFSLPEGKYVFEVTYAGEPHRDTVWVNTDAETRVRFASP